MCLATVFINVVYCGHVTELKMEFYVTVKCASEEIGRAHV